MHFLERISETWKRKKETRWFNVIANYSFYKFSDRNLSFEFNWTEILYCEPIEVIKSSY